MPTDSAAETSFSLAEARKIVADLFEPNPRIYWADMLLSFTVGSVCYELVRLVKPLSALQAGLFVVSCLAFYRAASFSHELVHLRTESFRAFRVVWNLVCGIPFLMPSFTYYTHLDHHRRKLYGTQHDGEYLALAAGRPRLIAWYLLQALVFPGLAVVRFLVLTPLCWCSPRLRRWVQTRMSSMVMDPSYVRPLPTPEVLRVWRWQEAACFLLSLGVLALLVRGRWPWTFLLHAYLTGSAVLLLNSIRTLGAHRFVNDGHEMTFVEQLVDSLNYPRRPWLTEIWAPVGLRFHALHHLFPSLPYHALPEGHRRLMAQLPADSPYRLTESHSLWQSLRQLWRQAQASAARHSESEKALAAPQAVQLPQS